MSKRPSITVLLLGFFFLVQLPLVVQPIGGGHIWRQADTASVARNLALESFDPFHPRVDVRQHLTGITGMEFPVYQSLAGLLYLVAPTSQDWPARLISLLMAFGCLGYTVLLARKLLDLPAKWVVCAMICLQEFFLQANRTMPEATALCMVLMGTWHFLRYRDSGKPVDLLLAWLGFTLGLLARPYVGSWGLIILVEFLFSLKANPRRSAVFLALGVGVLVPFAFWYFYWAPHLTEAYGLPLFFTGGSFESVLQKLASFNIWVLLADALVYDYAHWIMVPFVLLGIHKLRRHSNWDRDHTVLLVGVPLLTIASILLLTGDHFKPHTYYLIALIPALAISAATGLSALAQRRPKVGRWLVAALPILTVALLGYVYTESAEDLERYGRVQQEVEKRVPPEDLVVTDSGGSLGFSLHVIRRRGWGVASAKVADPAFIAEAENLGARWVLPLQDGRFQLYSIGEWRQHLATKP